MHSNRHRHRPAGHAAGEQSGHGGTPEAIRRPAHLETYEGDHRNKVMQRLEEKVIPFFAQHLAFK